MSKTTKGLVKAFLITVVLLAGLIFLTGGGAAKLALEHIVFCSLVISKRWLPTP